ncbi:amidohydrolase family protein [Aquabacterium sp.]|uniref:N-acyl-D-amino-acid deacylase family protein n=1 Tax=Aquabacterium sp. TaxID=1872578 RepID=UPI00378386C1
MAAVFDWLIRGAELIDGSGRPRFAADVGLAQDRIAAVLPPGQGQARRVMAAEGLVLCPGFIDTHAHDDLLALMPTQPHPKLAQGVCTVVVGNCGISLAPLQVDQPPAPLDLVAQGAPRFACFADYLQALDDARPSVNVVPLVGHTSLRLAHVADLSRSATAAEVAAMRAAVGAALDAGAFGLSTGVYYPPARAASTDELMGVCDALRGRDAMLAMHLRDEGDHLEAAVQEALQVGAACQARLVLSHHKVVLPHNHGKTRRTLQAVDAAAAGQAVCLDCYPYEASSTMLDADRAARVQEVLVTWSTPHPACSGRSLRSIAGDWGVSLHEAARRLLPGGAIYFTMAAEDVERVLQHPLTMIGSDGLPHDRHPHPRLWGSFPRVLGHYSRDRALLPLEAAVHKMTGLPAQRFGLHDRGRVAPGQMADLVLFDPATVRDNASYAEPTAPPSGIEAVWVNGVLALQRGEYLDLRAGQRLRPAPMAG